MSAIREISGAFILLFSLDIKSVITSRNVLTTTRTNRFRHILAKTCPSIFLRQKKINC